ncbi:hypothetical protein VCHENC01_1350 [Vibrio harveyi]|nr:hypothetical protein VCHENC01_1350 [Vibrio harveyi]
MDVLTYSLDSPSSAHIKRVPVPSYNYMENNEWLVFWE